MATVTNITKEDLIDLLITNDLDHMDDCTVADVLREGCKGYNNQSVTELKEAYSHLYEDEINITA